MDIHKISISDCTRQKVGAIGWNLHVYLRVVLSHMPICMFQEALKSSILITARCSATSR